MNAATLHTERARLARHLAAAATTHGLTPDTRIAPDGTVTITFTPWPGYWPRTWPGARFTGPDHHTTTELALTWLTARPIPLNLVLGAA